MNTKKIAKEYGLRVIHVNKKNLKKVSEKYDIDKEDLKNNAYIIENEDIILGIFDDNDLKTAAFFHEIGHTLVRESFENLVQDDEMLVEYQAWIEGLRIAKKYKIEFSNKMLKYILKSVNTYYKTALNSYNKKIRKEKNEKANGPKNKN